LRVRKVLEKKQADISKILSIINQTTLTLKDIPSIDTVSIKIPSKIEDIQEWLSLTHWSQNQLEMLNKIQNQLIQLKIIDKRYF
jgi:hypothetical protein